MKVLEAAMKKYDPVLKRLNNGSKKVHE